MRRIPKTKYEHKEAVEQHKQANLVAVMVDTDMQAATLVGEKRPREDGAEEAEPAVVGPSEGTAAAAAATSPNGRRALGAHCATLVRAAADMPHCGQCSVRMVLKYELVGFAEEEPAPKKAKAADEPGSAGKYTARPALKLLHTHGLRTQDFGALGVASLTFSLYLLNSTCVFMNCCHHTCQTCCLSYRGTILVPLESPVSPFRSTCSTLRVYS